MCYPPLVIILFNLLSCFEFVAKLCKQPHKKFDAVQSASSFPLELNCVFKLALDGAKLPRSEFEVQPSESSSVGADSKLDKVGAASTEARPQLPEFASYNPVLSEVELQSFVDMLGVPSEKVWLMAVTKDRPDLTQPEVENLRRRDQLRVVNTALKFGYNYSHRAHIDLWGTRRGV